MADFVDPIPVNPYESPRPFGDGPKPNWWKRTCLLGLATMIVAAMLLCGSAEFQHRGVTFRHAHLAILLLCSFVCGTAIFLVGGLGWLIRTLRRTSRRGHDLGGEAQGAGDGES